MAHFAGTRKLAFAIRTSKIQGKGAFATRRIKKGARIIEYLGECIDEAESDIRYPDDEMGRHHTFLFSIGDGSRVLDAGPIDWPAKYINHSCDPNCEAVEEEDGRVFIGALKTIEEGTELLYDYAYERTPEHTEADLKLYVCRCGSPKCRGTIMAPLKETKKDKKKKDKKNKKDKKSKQEKLDGKANRDEEKQQEKEASRKQDADTHTDLPAAHAAKHSAKKADKKAAKKAAKKHAEKGSAKKGAAKKGAAKKGGAKKGAAKKAGTQGKKGQK